MSGVLTEEQEAVANDVVLQFTDALEAPMSNAVDGLEAVGMSRYDAVHSIAVMMLTQAITNLRSAGVKPDTVRVYVEVSLGAIEREITRKAESGVDVTSEGEE